MLKIRKVREYLIKNIEKNAAVVADDYFKFIQELLDYSNLLLELFESR